MPGNQRKSALIMGGSGLVGQSLLKAILLENYYTEVTLVLRRPIDLKCDAKVKDRDITLWSM